MSIFFDRIPLENKRQELEEVQVFEADSGIDEHLRFVLIGKDNSIWINTDWCEDIIDELKQSGAWLASITRNNRNIEVVFLAHVIEFLKSSNDNEFVECGCKFEKMQFKILRDLGVEVN